MSVLGGTRAIAAPVRLPVRTSARLLRQQPLTATAPLISRRYKSGPYGYTQAKALIFSKFGEPVDVLQLHKHSISPSLPDDAVLLRTLAAPVNPSDVNTIQGTYGVKPEFSKETQLLLGTPEPCAIPGHEGCFEVVSVGPGVQSGLKRGDWVIPAISGFGTFRTHALVRDADKKLWKIDHGDLTPIQVAQVSVNPCSAYRMLKDYVDLVGLSVQTFQNDPECEGGAWFIQNGANSGVGRAAIQLGRLWGLRSINIIRERSTPEATEALKKELTDLGATVVVTESEFIDNHRAFAAELKEKYTRGGKDPIMLGLNCVGGKSAANIVRTLSPKGVMVTYGGMSRQSFPFPTGPVIFKRLRLEGFWVSAWGRENPAEKRKTIDEILGLMRKGEFKAAPVDEVRWDWDTEEKTLKDAIQGTLQGFRRGKGLFVFGET
ncbi:NONE-like protein [Diplogelasinospora grovesii]|uniref:enoyl-[acyl-carrier-protein] reductase n=1 Tax=Diplogelasinospora grovesii TaxID=303347 RepID=A0AAN6NE47_9PEZI|nr:NONE-like protein [Diplogelasinospora grovesii]